MGRKIPDNYITVKTRVAKFCNDHKEKGTILTDVTLYPDQSAALVKATIKIADVVRATGHALADLDEDKGLEKGETVAIGRALEHVGYSSVDGAEDGENEDQQDSEAPQTERKSDFSRNRSALPPASESAKAPASEPAAKAESKKEAPPAQATATESPAPEKAPAQEEPAKETPPPSAPKSKMADLMAKYGGARAGSSTSNLKR